MAGRTTVVVPDLGDFSDVEVIEVLVKAGDTVAVEAPLITLETDKATMDVPSTVAGRVTEVAVKKGDRISKGSPIVVVESAAEAPKAPAAKAAAAMTAAPARPPATPAAAQAATLEVRVPELGDFKDVEVIEVLVKEGETVALETPLVTLETEKARWTCRPPPPAASRSCMSARAHASTPGTWSRRWKARRARQRPTVLRSRLRPPHQRRRRTRKRRSA